MAESIISYEEIELNNPIGFKRGWGYWDVTNYPYGGDFKRFDGSEVGTRIKGQVKLPREIRVLLSDNRTIVVKDEAVIK